MNLARRIYSREMKIAVMKEIDGGKSIAEVARRLLVNPSLIEKWRADWRTRRELAFPGNNGRRELSEALSDQQKIAELERKIGQLTMENDFLKKTLQHFRDQLPPAVISGETASSKKSSKPPEKARP